MPLDPKDYPYLNPTPKTEIIEARCLNCGETRDSHAGDHEACLFNSTTWRTDQETLIDTNSGPMIKDPDLYEKVVEEEADDSDPMVQMMKKAIKN